MSLCLIRRIRPKKTCEFKIKATRNCPYFIRCGYLRCTTNIHEILSVIVINVDLMKSIQDSLLCTTQAVKAGGNLGRSRSLNFRRSSGGRVPLIGALGVVYLAH